MAARCERNANGRRVAWADDEFWWDAEAGARERGKTLLVRTEPAMGLTPEDLDRLVAWAST